MQPHQRDFLTILANATIYLSAIAIGDLVYKNILNARSRSARARGIMDDFCRKGWATRIAVRSGYVYAITAEGRDILTADAPLLRSGK